MASDTKRIRLELPALLPWQREAREAIESARFTTLIVGRRSGKTTLSALLAGRCALEGGDVLWVAPSHDLASVGREKIEELFRPAIKSSRLVPSSITFHGGGRILFRSLDRPGASLGRAFDLVVVDESARVDGSIITGEVLPTLADRNGKLVSITTPRGSRNWTYDWHRRAIDGNAEYATVHGTTLDNPHPDIRAFVEVARREMPDDLFRQEILGEFLAGSGTVFRNVSEIAILDSYLPGPLKGRRYVLGADVAVMSDWTVLYALDVLTGELAGCDRFQGVDWTVAKERIGNFWRAWNCSPLWIDSTGLGKPVVDDLRAQGVRVQPYHFTSDSKSELVVGLMNAIEKQEITIPRDEVLVNELVAFEYQTLPSGRFRYGAPSGAHDDAVCALMLAVHGRRRSLSTGVARSGVGSFESDWHVDHDPMRQRF